MMHHGLSSSPPFPTMVSRNASDSPSFNRPWPQDCPLSPTPEPPPGHGGPARPQHLGRDCGKDGPLPRHGDALQQGAQVDVWDHGEVGPFSAMNGWAGPLAAEAPRPTAAAPRSSKSLNGLALRVAPSQLAPEATWEGPLHPCSHSEETRGFAPGQGGHRVNPLAARAERWLILLRSWQVPEADLRTHIFPGSPAEQA